jgi:tellurium resistance protein TerD
LDGKGAVLETIYFGNKISQGGAVIHSGDNTTGDGKGDDETIIIDFKKLHPNVDSILASHYHLYLG